MAHSLEAAMLGQPTGLTPTPGTIPQELVLMASQLGHGLAALMFAALVGWQLTMRVGGIRRLALTAACAVTALWCALVAVFGGPAIPPSIAKSLADGAWLAFLFALQPPTQPGRRRPAMMLIYILLAILILAVIVIKLLPLFFLGSPRIQESLFLANQALRFCIAAGAVCLLHNLYAAALPEARSGFGPPMLALAVMWTFDANLAMVASLTGSWPLGLFAVRGLVLIVIAPLLVTVSRLDTLGPMRVSRSAGFQAVTLAIGGVYLAAMVLLARILAVGGRTWLLSVITLAAAFLIFAIVFFPSTRFRERTKKALARHLFRHRYDYRVEWRRFTETVGQPGAAAAGLAERTIQAVAEIFESGGGLLMLRTDDGGLESAAQWNWRDLAAPQSAGSADLAVHLEASRDVIELARIRQGESIAALSLVPEWMLAHEDTWALVPLIHFDQLIGAILLQRPEQPRMLDEEDDDLLRVAGRQVASYLAEARGQEALSNARRFDEFNRRFAFIMHDIKNLVSQLSLLARNAERHADNPEFRADMIGTLQNSVGKMNDLLARLSQHHRPKPAEPAVHSLRELAEQVLRGRAAAYPVRIVADGDVMVTVDPARFEQALGHIVQNAIDASDGEPVEIHLGSRGLQAMVEVVDRGHGMSAEFIRSKLFDPFASTKEGGFGIGAFEARSIVAGMGGSIEVESRPGEGSRFTILLPMAALLGGTRSGTTA